MSTDFGRRPERNKVRDRTFAIQRSRRRWEPSPLSLVDGEKKASGVDTSVRLNFWGDNARNFPLRPLYVAPRPPCLAACTVAPAVRRSHSRSTATSRVAFLVGNGVQRPDQAFSKFNRPAHRYLCLRFNQHFAMPAARLEATMDSLSIRSLLSYRTLSFPTTCWFIPAHYR